MYINSGGGIVTAGLAIYDTMQVHPVRAGLLHGFTLQHDHRACVAAVCTQSHQHTMRWASCFHGIIVALCWRGWNKEILAKQQDHAAPAIWGIKGNMLRHNPLQSAHMSCISTCSISITYFWSVQGQASDIAIHTNELLTIRSRINELYVKHTGQPLQRIGELQRFPSRSWSIVCL